MGEIIRDFERKGSVGIKKVKTAGKTSILLLFRGFGYHTKERIIQQSQFSLKGCDCLQKKQKSRGRFFQTSFGKNAPEKNILHLCNLCSVLIPLSEILMTG